MLAAIIAEQLIAFAIGGFILGFLCADLSPSSGNRRRKPSRGAEGSGRSR
jgi:hypothetical protein